MADTRCIAIKSSDGGRCSKRATINGRCNNHYTIMTREGPNTTEVDEIRYVFKARRKIMHTQHAAAITALGPQPWNNNRDAYREMIRVHGVQDRELIIEQHTRVDTVIDRQRADIARTGINPDAVQDARRQAERQVQHNEALARLEAWRIREAERQRLLAAQRGVPAVAARPNVGLGGFANDRQNVHTTTAVKQTMHIIKEILKIEVPSEYRWNMKTVSKTMSEIISDCGLTPASAWQMVAKYCSDDIIYDLEPGIYGKVLDCVWQYIQNSPDKEDLKKILKSEMRDNIGMCAQGNLSRLTNILAGYLECVVAEESMTEKLGRILPPLMAIEDIAERLVIAARLFVELGVPDEQWGVWAQGLLIDQEEDDHREMLIRDGTIQFIVFT